MRVVVLGGTGRTGGRIVQALVEAGHAAVAVGRSARPDGVPPGAESLAADVSAPGELERAIAGSDAVVVCLSIPRASGSPFAAITGPPDLHSAAARRLIAAYGTGRVVKISAQGVGDSAPRAGWLFRGIVAASNVGVAFADHAIADDLVRASPLRWTILRPPRLGDADDVRPVEAGEQLTTSSFTALSRGALARFVVDTLTDDRSVRRVLTMRPR